MNTILHDLGESPVDPRKSKCKQYLKAKKNKPCSENENYFWIESHLTPDSETKSNDGNILNSLKIKLKSSTTSRKEKIVMLTLLPKT